MVQQNASPLRKGGDDPIEVDPPTIRVKRSVSLVAGTAAPIIAEAPTGTRTKMLERLLETGARAEAAYRTNLTAQLFERRVEALGQTLGGELAAILKAGGNSMEERLTRLLHRHEKDLLAQTMRFLDPASEEGLPSAAARKLREVTDAAIQQVNELLAEGDTGALARWADKITRQVQETERNVLAQLVRKQAVTSTGFHKGRSFEEAVSAKLAQVGVAIGYEVERCSDQLGVKRTRHGDHAITLEVNTTGGEAARIVTEEKARGNGDRFSYEAVRKECEKARANREASACVFVAEARESLPDGVVFGQVGRADFFVHFDPATGDDVGLVAALYLARAAALQRLQAGGSDRLDRVAARRLVDEIRDRVERRDRIERFHNSAVKAIHGAARTLDEDTEAVLACLARFDAMLAM